MQLFSITPDTYNELSIDMVTVTATSTRPHRNISSPTWCLMPVPIVVLGPITIRFVMVCLFNWFPSTQLASNVSSSQFNGPAISPSVTPRAPTFPSITSTVKLSVAEGFYARSLYGLRLNLGSLRRSGSGNKPGPDWSAAVCGVLLPVFRKARIHSAQRSTPSR